MTLANNFRLKIHKLISGFILIFSTFENSKDHKRSNNKKVQQKQKPEGDCIRP